MMQLDMLDGIRAAAQRTELDERTGVVLRDYQRACLDELLRRFARGERKQIVCAPTGSGKTVLAAHMLASAYQRRKRALFVCDRLALVDQTSAALRAYGIRHGIVQGMRSSGARIRVVSAQTMEQRRWPENIDLLIVDEAHTIRKNTVEYIGRTRASVVGLTATPFSDGLSDIYDGVVNSAVTNRLIEQGWIVPPRVYAATEIDMEGAAKSNGEWTAKAAEERGVLITGDIVTHWIERTRSLFGGPVKTLVFSATVRHGEDLCEQFQAEGHDFRQISYLDRDLDKRNALIQKFRDGEVMGLVSVEALAKGFDVPDVRVLVSARPYSASLAAHIQQIGRVLRPAPGKQHGVIFDHAGNWLGFRRQTERFFERGISDLSEAAREDKKRADKPRKPSVCHKCQLILAPSDVNCPACGTARPRRRSDVIVRPGELSELPSGKAAMRGESWHGRQPQVWHAMRARAQQIHPHDQERARKLALAQYHALFGGWPSHSWTREKSPPIDPELFAAVRDVMDREWRQYQRSNKQRARV